MVAMPSSAEELVIKAGRVFTGAGIPLAPGAVHVKDGKIVAVATTLAAPSGVKVVDLGDGVLLPGLVDAFTSIAVEGGNAEATKEITPDFRIANALDWSAPAWRQARAEGITTVALTPGTANVITGLSCIAKSGGDRQRRLVKAEHALVLTLASDPASGNSARNRPDSIYNRQPTNRMGVVWMLRSEFGLARSVPTKARTVLGEALAKTRPVVCVSRSESDIVAALRLREDYPMDLAIAGGQEAYKLRAELAAAKAPILLGPISTSAGSGPESTETILNLAGLLHEAGVPIALTGGNLLDQARFAWRFGLPRDAALAAITSAPAKMLGLGGKVGSIAVGGDADLVALSGDPFDVTSKVRWTMINGAMQAEEP
jgi:imidazolonepropionase-like amidohydrolase